MQVKVEAIDPERQVKVVPFLYLSKDASLEAVPFGISLDKEEDEGDDLKVHGVKIVQKTLHSEDSYQVFEFAKKRQGDDEPMKGDFGVFALNIKEMKDVEIWQPELVLEKYAP